MKVIFNNIHNENLKGSFLDVLNKYKILHEYEIQLIRRKRQGTTMRAVPVLDPRVIIFGIRKYRITISSFVQNKRTIPIGDLPKKVMDGWFAHELGHIVHYLNRSPFNMLIYGIRYLTDSSYRKIVEWEADKIAIKHGFRDEILKTKKFILEHDLLDSHYKEKIKKYYMPIPEVEKYLLQQIPIDPIDN